uniref:Putative secreted protein n=1 Tax=Anopheles marajoara TaxID=58244 RepID=A0A2M4CF49_9DIPT
MFMFVTKMVLLVSRLFLSGIRGQLARPLKPTLDKSLALCCCCDTPSLHQFLLLAAADPHSGSVACSR